MSHKKGTFQFQTLHGACQANVGPMHEASSGPKFCVCNYRRLVKLCLYCSQICVFSTLFACRAQLYVAEPYPTMFTMLFIIQTRTMCDMLLGASRFLNSFPSHTPQPHASVRYNRPDESLGLPTYYTFQPHVNDEMINLGQDNIPRLINICTSSLLTHTDFTVLHKCQC